MGNQFHQCLENKNKKLSSQDQQQQQQEVGGVTNKQSINNNNNNNNNKQSVKGSVINTGSFIMRKQPVLDQQQTVIYEQSLKKITCEDSDKFLDKINQCVMHLASQNHQIVAPIHAASHVYQIEDTDTGLIFAVKFINQSDKQYKESYDSLEAFLQMQDTHSFVKIIEYSNLKRQDVSYMIMELCENNLEKLMEEQKAYSLEEGVHLCMKLLSMLIDIHSSGLSHLSINLRKILMDLEGNYKFTGIPQKESKGKKKITILDQDPEEAKDNTFKAPEQVDSFEGVKQVSFISCMTSREDLQQVSSFQNSSIFQKIVGQEDLNQRIDIFSIGMVALALLGVKINKESAAEIRGGNFSVIGDMKHLNPLVSFITHYMLQTDPLQRSSAIKLQSEILIHFYKLNIGDNLEEIQRLKSMIQQEDQMAESQLNLSRYQSLDFGEISRSRKRTSQAKLQISKKLAYLQFNYYLQFIHTDKSEFAKKSIILAKNTEGFKKEEILLFEYYFQYRSSVVEGWVYSLTCRNIFESNYNLRQKIYQEKLAAQSVVATLYQQDVFDSLNALANSLIYSYESSSSIQYLTEVLEFRKSIFGEKNHPDIAQTLSDLGDAYSKMKDFKQALTFYTQALDMRREIFNNQNNQFIIASLFNKSKAYFQMGNENEAKQLDQEALYMVEQMKSQEILSNRNSERECSLEDQINREQKKQIDNKMQILLDKVEAYPRVNPFKAELLLQIATEYDNNNNFQQCLIYNNKIIDIYTSLFGENNLKSFQRIKKQGEFYKNIKDYKQSFAYTQRALKIAISLDLLAKSEVQEEYELVARLMKN